MREDFGWSGNEFMLGDCQDDWQFDWVKGNAEVLEDENDPDGQEAIDIIRKRQEADPDYDPDKGDDIGQELDMADPNYSLHDEEEGEEGDLFDIVRQHEEEFCDPDYPQEGGEYGECTWEED